MKKSWMLPAALLFGSSSIAQSPPPMAAPPTMAPVTASAPEIAFDAINPLKPPLDMQLGEVAGVALGKTGHIFVFQRGNTSGPAYGAAAAQLLEFAADGRYLREIGKNLYAWAYAHSVKLDPAGNIWVADKGSDMVIKFTPEGRVAMVVGRKTEASDENAHPWARPKPPLPPIEGLFRQVTDMAWDSHGNTYISDGYINSRVAKLAPDGRWLKSWGSPGDGPGQFNTPHTIAFDAADRLYVGDRGNRRIQVFDTDGKLLKIIEINVASPPDAPMAIGAPGGAEITYSSPIGRTFKPGSPWAICITPPTAGHQQYLYVADANPGRIYKLTLDGKVLGWIGGAGKQIKQFGWIHQMACPSENELYVGEILNWRVQKLTLHPTQEER